jgi:hypothetical protein
MSETETATEVATEPAAPAPVPAPAPDPEAAHRARALAAQGATVILDPESDASLAARGGMADDMTGNIEARNNAMPPEVHAGTHGGIVRGRGRDAKLHQHLGVTIGIPAQPD